MPGQLRLLRRCAPLLGAIAVLLSAAGASAATPAPRPFSLTLTPARLTVPASMAASTQVVTLANNGGTAVHVTAARYDFTQAPEGDIRFTPPGPLSAASWLAVTPAAFELYPGHRQRVRIRIAVPANPEPGEHQVGVVFSVPAGKTTRNIAINRGIGTQLLISVPGPVVRRTALTALTVPRFVDGHSATITATVQNSGTVHRDFVRPTPLVAHVHGDSVAFPDFTVLRGSRRVVSTSAPHLPLACWCQVTVATDD